MTSTGCETQDMMVSELEETLKAREETYSFLAAAYRAAPSADFLLGLFDELGGEDENGESPGCAALRKWAAAAAGRDPANMEEELAREYARLFYDTASAAYVKPYESVYTSVDGMLMQAAHAEVMAAYREEGLARAADYPEPEDHLAPELEFMACLNARARDALGYGQAAGCLGYLEKQRRFVEGHLLAWVPRFLDDLQKTARGGFYGAVAAITRETVEAEPAQLPALIEVCSEI